jgi:uncharacterized protein YecT (DUF1311 family)
MLLHIALILVGQNVAPCEGTSTPQVEACLSSQLEESDATLDRYLAAATQRARKEGGGESVQRLNQAHRLWVAFREAECAAVRERWRDGTIRGSMDLDCRIRLARLRTYTVWRDWLTYPDSTPPTLPRPDTDAVTSERRTP